jgi:hypothetical protein
MQATAFVECAFAALLLCSSASASVAATVDPAATKPAIPYEFCVSDPATRTKVYISPTFQDPLHDVHEAFAGYLGNSHGFRGNAQCYTLPSQELADEFRNEEIQILHWQGMDHVIATPWKPVEDARTPEPSLVDAR